MTDQIYRPEQEVPQSQVQSDVAREAEHHVREARDVPKYHFNTDGSIDRQFRDKQGRWMDMRIQGADADTIHKWEQDPSTAKSHQCQIRVADIDEAHKQPAFADRGRVAQAEASLEPPGKMGNESTRVRLSAIEVNPSHEGAGIGGAMLDEVEQLAHDAGASEVYGDYSPKAGQEAATKAFYESHDYQFRSKPGDGTEVYKPVGGPASDAQALKQEARYRA